MFDKTKLIYQKPKSITRELCKEFIDVFNTETILHPKISSITLLNKDTNAEIKQKWKFLYKELCFHVDKYTKDINQSTQVSKTDNNDIPFETIQINTDKIEFSIQKDKYEEGGQNVFFEKKITKYTKILKFMWFLNNYDGEIVFWKECAIRPTAGMFLLFPTSWCVPYEELLPMNFERYVITGYVQYNF